MHPRPFFSVVLSTYGRGEHIRPTIESVLRQTYSDFELVVVGDGCADNTAAVVGSFKSRRVSWHNLEQNTGSQSFPNNLGIARSTGNWIAYIGHDDIWSPNHLTAMRDVIDADTYLDCVVSGCIYYGPKDSAIFYVTGIFDSDRAQFEHFFPPSSFAHRREILDLIEPWRDPRTVTAPVDCDFLLRAAHAGLRFSSTEQITVHKFAAGHRYLSYMTPDAEEQWMALQDPQLADNERLSAIIESCKQQGRFMAMGYPDFSKYQNGQLFDANRSNKGILRPALRKLDSAVTIEQTAEPRGLDWYGLESGCRPFRWSGPNPKPKILIPYAYPNEVRITLHVSAVAPLRDVRIQSDGHPIDYEIHNIENSMQTMVLRTHLNESDYSILTVHTPEMRCPHEQLGNGDTRRLGIALSDIVIEPT
jgi:glycosyltransferase involved in cell wall biosynthesis